MAPDTRPATTPASDHTTGFQHRAQPDCTCPIHENQRPFTAPLGLRFADAVTVEEIPAETAEAIYQAHHSYMPTLPDVNLVHHGLYHQDQLLGAITYRTPLIGKKALYFDRADQLQPDPRFDITDLPQELRATARRITPDSPTTDLDRRVVSGGEIVEAARMCIGVEFPNFASASLARSMEAFARDYATDYNYLLTFVRADYDASMIRALRDKGWLFYTATPPSQASNRTDREIREAYKWQFICDLPDDTSQTPITDWLT